MSCNCIFCRRKEFGDAYVMHLYTSIMEEVSTYIQFKDWGYREGSIDDTEPIPRMMACIACNVTDGYFQEINDNPQYIDTLKRWKLYDNYKDAEKRLQEVRR